MVFKCKMCGAPMEIREGMTICECKFCNTQQTLPRIDNEQKINMLNRANHFRQQCEFDQAMEIYEKMISTYEPDAELYWSMVLCRYGIEYVDDPVSKKKIATCHRTQFKSILDDPDYLMAMEYADVIQREVYQREAQYIDKIQKNILEISNKEEPFDVFICYKETDDTGARTQDSVLAQELYFELVNEGFKVFFSRITLESKLGTEYEPYIFSALNTAKVMVVVGTKAEYYNAVWVKNEWSRYLMLMHEDKKRIMIPAYKDMDPYDLPVELSMFQAQDMSKLGFMQDLIRGIQKILQKQSNIDTHVHESSEKTTDLHEHESPVLSEREKRANGPKLIRMLGIIGTNDVNNPFPTGAYTNCIDRSVFSVASMQIILEKPFGYNGIATYHMDIYDSLNNLLTSFDGQLQVVPEYDKVAKTIYVVGTDGTKMETGNYRLEAWVNDSQVFVYQFRIIDSMEGKKANNNQSADDNSFMLQLLLQERSEIESKLNSLKGIFIGRGKRLELEERLRLVNNQINTLLNKN